MATASSAFSPADFIAAEYSHSADADLAADPIDPSWIIAGTPVARAKQLHQTGDGLYVVALWDCTAGSFRWHFWYDEVVHILEGEVTVREDNGKERTLRAGDIALFPKGATNVWTVNQYVRKIAINRFHRSLLATLVKNVLQKIRGK